MPRIELTAAEAATMRHIIESYLGDLRMEIADTDALEFRTELKEREALLRSVIDRLRKG